MSERILLPERPPVEEYQEEEGNVEKMKILA